MKLTTETKELSTTAPSWDANNLMNERGVDAGRGERITKDITRGLSVLNDRAMAAQEYVGSGQAYIDDVQKSVATVQPHLDKLLVDYIKRTNAKKHPVPAMWVMAQAGELYRNFNYSPHSRPSDLHDTQLFYLDKNKAEQYKDYWVRYAYNDLIEFESNVVQTELLIVSMFDVLSSLINCHFNKENLNKNPSHLLISHLATRYTNLSGDYVLSGITPSVFEYAEYQNSEIMRPVIEMLFHSIGMVQSFYDKRTIYNSFSGEPMPSPVNYPVLSEDMAYATIEWMATEIYKPQLKTFYGKIVENAPVYGAELLWMLEDYKVGLKAEKDLFPVIGGKSVASLINRVANAQYKLRLLQPIAVAYASTLLMAMDILPNEKDYIATRLHANFDSYLLPKRDNKWFITTVPHENDFLKNHDYQSKILFLEDNAVAVLNPIVRLSERIYVIVSGLLNAEINGVKNPVYNPLTEDYEHAFEPVALTDGSGRYGYMPIDAELRKAKARNDDIRLEASKKVLQLVRR